MALHHELPIYKAAFDLLGLAVDLTRNIPRDFKRQLGDVMRDECVRGSRQKNIDAAKRRWRRITAQKVAA